MDKKAAIKDNPKPPKMEKLSSKDSRCDALDKKYKEKLAKIENELANSKSRAKYGWDRAKIELAKTKKELTETKKELRETKVKLDAEEKWHAYYRNVLEQYHKCMTGMTGMIDSLKETKVFGSMERLRKKKRKTNSMEPMMKKAKTTGEGDGEDKN